MFTIRLTVLICLFAVTHARQRQNEYTDLAFLCYYLFSQLDGEKRWKTSFELRQHDYPSKRSHFLHMYYGTTMIDYVLRRRASKVKGQDAAQENGLRGVSFAKHFMSDHRAPSLQL
jgi:hypothetical protein